MHKRGVPKGADADEIRERFDKLFEEFEEMHRDPKAKRGIEASVRISSYLSSEDLETQFTC